MRAEFNLIIDFDHTLFNTDAFLKEVQSVSKQYRISKKQFYRAFSNVTDGRGDAPYSFEEHVKAISAIHPVDEKALLADLSEIIPNSSKFLYPDSVPFLRKIRKWNIHTHLVTFANSDMRTSQLTAIAMDKWIDSIHIISSSREGKISYIKEMLAASIKFAIIDDHPKILKALENERMLLIRLRRKIYKQFSGVEPKLIGVPVFANLSSTYSFLEPILKTLGRRR